MLEQAAFQSGLTGVSPAAAARRVIDSSRKVQRSIETALERYSKGMTNDKYLAQTLEQIADQMAALKAEKKRVGWPRTLDLIDQEERGQIESQHREIRWHAMGLKDRLHSVMASIAANLPDDLPPDDSDLYDDEDE